MLVECAAARQNANEFNLQLPTLSINYLLPLEKFKLMKNITLTTLQSIGIITLKILFTLFLTIFI